MISRFIKGAFSVVMVSLVALSSCADDKIDRERPITPPNPDKHDAEVLFEINMPQTVMPSTYALTSIEENNIKTIEILLFDNATQKYIGKPYFCDQIEDVVDPTNPFAANKFFSVSLPTGGPYDIVILANSREAVVTDLAALVGGEPKKDVLALLKMDHAGKWISKSSDANYKPIPMWGEVTGKTITENTKFAANLMRMLAKINVALDASIPQAFFDLFAVHLIKSSIEGHIVPDPLKIDAGTGRVNAPTLVGGTVPAVTSIEYLASDEQGGNRKIENVIYTFEADKAVAGSLATATCIVVQAKYNGDEKNFYRLDFGSESGGTVTYLDILRNFRYDINIVNVSGAGYPTLDEAIKNPATNTITTNLTVWDNAEFPLVIFDNVYALGLSGDDITLGYRASNYTDQLQVKTTFPGGWAIDPVIEYAAGSGSGWFTVNTTAPAAGNETEKAYIDFDITENTASTERVCYMHISAGPLKHKIKVTQRAIALGFADKIVWNNYDGKVNGVADGDADLTSITIEQAGAAPQTSTISNGVIAPLIDIYGAITKVTVVYKDYALVTTKYSFTAPNNTITVTDNTLIGKPVHMDRIRDDMAGSYIQVSDVNLASFANWVPIGDDDPTTPNHFTGNYNGASISGAPGFKINNLNIDRAAEDNVGLFGYAVGSTFKNMHIASGSVKGSDNVGSIVGRNSGTIANSSNAATVEGASNVGGLCGQIFEGAIDLATNTGSVTVAHHHVGGIVGYSVRGKVTNCSNNAPILSKTAGSNGGVGGIIGYSQGVTSVITDCTNLVKGTVIGASGSVGGIVGNNESDGDVGICKNLSTTVTGTDYVGGLFGSNAGNIGINCSSVATVTGVNQVGGICGLNEGKITGITNSIALTATGSIVGGICGSNRGKIEDCSNKAFISNTGAESDNIGGITGVNSTTGGVFNCKNLSGGEVTGKRGSVAGIVGYNGGAVEGCTNAATVASDSYNVGGIVGYNIGKILNCTNGGSIKGLSSYVGGICGQSDGATTEITSCENLSTGKVEGSQRYVGGIAGSNSSGTVSDCTNSAIVGGIGAPLSEYVGGITGRNGGTIKECANGGAVSGVSIVGGIAGYCTGKITGKVGVTTNKGPITGTGSNIGGICGHNDKGTLEICTNEAPVTADVYNAGGIVGLNNGAGATVTKCRNLLGGAVYGKDTTVGGIAAHNAGEVSACSNEAIVKGGAANVGGISGHNNLGTIKACWNSGLITGKIIRVAGIAAHNTGTVSACYNIGGVSGTTEIGAVIGANDGTITACYFGGAAAGMVAGGGIAFSVAAAPVGWPSPTGDWAPAAGYWFSLGSWNNGSPIYPTLKP